MEQDLTSVSCRQWLHRLLYSELCVNSLIQIGSCKSTVSQLTWISWILLSIHSLSHGNNFFGWSLGASQWATAHRALSWFSLSSLRSSFWPPVENKWSAKAWWRDKKPAGIKICWSFLNWICSIYVFVRSNPCLDMLKSLQLQLTWAWQL